MTKIVHDELVDLMGGTNEGLNLSEKPTIILIAGLQGLVKRHSPEISKLPEEEKEQKPFIGSM